MEMVSHMSLEKGQLYFTDKGTSYVSRKDHLNCIRGQFYVNGKGSFKLMGKCGSFT